MRRTVRLRAATPMGRLAIAASACGGAGAPTAGHQSHRTSSAVRRPRHRRPPGPMTYGTDGGRRLPVAQPARSSEHAAAGNSQRLSGPARWRRVDVLPSGKRVQVDHLSLRERMPFVRQSARGPAGGADALADDRALASSRRPGDGARAARPAPVQELERVITRGRGVCQPREGRAARSSRAVTCPYPRARAGTGTSHLFFIGFAARGAALRGRHPIASVPPRAAAEPPGDDVSSRLPAGRRHGPAHRGWRELPQGRRPAGHRLREQALAQRAGPIAMGGSGPSTAPTCWGRANTAAGRLRSPQGRRPASESGAPVVTVADTGPGAGPPAGPEFRRCPARPARPAQGVRPAPSRAAGDPSAPSASSTGEAVPHRPPAAR